LRTFHKGNQLESVLAEREGSLVPDRMPVLLSTALALRFRQHLFGILYSRAHHNLSQIDLGADATSEVFVDVLVYMAGAADYSRPRPHESLRLLCDRTATRLTGVAPDCNAPAEGDESYDLADVGLN
jgi:hypothetical protein